MVGETNQFYDALLKIFKRKIKRSKKKDDDDDLSDSDEESEYESDEDSEYDSEEEEIDDTCPPGCEQQLYERVLELRDKKLDQEDILSEFQKAIDDLRKSNERQTTKERQIDKDLAQTGKEIQAFQTEKQRKLNELDIYIVQNLDQFKNLVDKEGNPAPDNCTDSGSNPLEEESGEETKDGSTPRKLQNIYLPSTIPNCLVFAESELVALRKRIDQLNVGNKALRTHFKDLHKEQKKLAREKDTKMKLILGLEERCRELQMLKFGQIIDLESLDKMTVSKTVKDLINKTKTLQIKHENALRKKKATLQSMKEESLKVLFSISLSLSPFSTYMLQHLSLVSN